MKRGILVLISCCIVSMTFLCACYKSRLIGSDWESKVSLSIVGIGDIFQDDNGTFCLEEVAYAKSIESGSTLYEDSDGGYLIVKMQVDFASYQLKECGVIIEDYSKPEITHRTNFWVNYFKNQHDEYQCFIQEDGDLHLELLGTNMHINESADKVCGKVYACFNLSVEIRDYLLDIRDGKYQINYCDSQFDIDINLNDIRYQHTTHTEIGCHFSELNFYETYQV